jgi:hypothetical protein
MSGEKITDLLVFQDGIRSLGKWCIKFRIDLFPGTKLEVNTIDETPSVKWDKVGSWYSPFFPTFFPIK